MKKILITILFFLPFMVFADTLPPSSSMVEFQNEPLFGETNFAPGNSVTKWVKLNNNTAESHRAIVRAVNAINSGSFKLGDATRLVIKEGSIVWYDGSFTNFFSKLEVLLGQIPAGEQRTYDFIVSFNPNSGNDYQNSTMGFNLQIGFEELDTTTDTTITISGQIGGGGGGSITSGSKHLIISEEEAVIQGSTGSVVVNWKTNISATSQVIFGLTNNGPYNINMSETYFGYPLGTTEQDLDPNKVINHSVIVSGLAPGDYVYRVVSRASPATISYEHKFTVNNAGEVLGISSANEKEKNNKNGEIAGTFDETGINDSASVFTSGFGNILSWWWLWILIILLAVYLFWRFVLKSRNEKN